MPRNNDNGARRPHAIDLHVGQRVRLQRLKMGMSQTELANSVGLTFQQVQKYESGANRISASRLVQIAISLAVPVCWFFDDAGIPIDADAFIDWTQDPRMMELYRSLLIFAPAVRNRVIDNVISLAHSFTQATADD